MFLTYLRRELTNRKKQTVIIAIGMALAIALVIIVSSISSGVKSAQSTVLQSVYGVGTDITVTKTSTPSASGGPGNFSFGGSDSTGSSSGSDGSSSTDLAQSRLAVTRGSGTLSAAAVEKVEATSGVSAATGVLTLTNSTFSGTVTQNGSSSSSGSSSTGSSSTGTQDGPPSGGGFGGGNFSVDQFTVTGIPVAGTAVGPLTAAELTKGRSFTSSDAGKDVVVLDKTYAKSASKTVGDTVSIGGTDFTVIGIVASTSSDSETASNTYIPLDTAQSLASLTGKVTSIYVSATSSSDVDSIKAALTKKLSGATVSDESDLASSVSGSLSTASSLVSNLGTWLSIVVLAAAFLIAILFTISGVSRRTREFGTLKAIGWSNGRITRQVAGESFVQGIIGGVAGAIVGLVGILVVNIISPTISASASTTNGGTGGPGGTGSGGFPGGAATAAAGSGSAATTGGAPAGGFGGGASTASTTDVVLHAPVTVEIIVVAIALAIVGGLLAGALGGWRASRLRPAEALRSVA